MSGGEFIPAFTGVERAALRVYKMRTQYFRLMHLRFWNGSRYYRGKNNGKSGSNILFAGNPDLQFIVFGHSLDDR